MYTAIFRIKPATPFVDRRERSRLNLSAAWSVIHCDSYYPLWLSCICIISFERGRGGWGGEREGGGREGGKGERGGGG